MKNSTLPLLATAMVVLFSAGCKTKPLHSTLPGDRAGASSEGGRNTPDLSTPPLAPGGGATGAGVSGTTIPTDLPNDDKLIGRDQDRTRFAGDAVYFAYDRSEVSAAEASKVTRVASAFKSLAPGHDLLVEGHCDERGTEGYNQALGERRALAVRDLLIQAGVDANHVFTKSMGKDQPVQVGHDDTAWSKNRRGEFVLVLPRKITTTQNSQ
jgi:peptidoglycan-associated lipoprotein